MTEICPRFQPGPWKFDGACNWDKRADHTCEYCGSMHPGDFMARVEAGTVLLGATDKNYKVYVTNAGGENFKQTYRDCPRSPPCPGYEQCTHWVTRDTDHGKFYFYHLSEEQKRRFVELLNAKALKFDGDIGFYVYPYFIGRAA